MKLKHLKSEDRDDAVGARHTIKILDPKYLNARSLDTLYTVEILHIISLQWSSIKIYLEENLMATSHLISFNHLPLETQIPFVKYPPSYQISTSSRNVMTLNATNEKAMLIRNINGDFAIVKGKWENLKKGTRGVRGNPGNLTVEIIFLEDKKIQTFEITNNCFYFEIENKNIQAKVDLRSGNINLKFLKYTNSTSANSETASMVAVASSIAAIHVLLQPKKVSNKKLESILTLTPLEEKRGDKEIKYLKEDEYLMFAMFGYSYLINSPIFVNYCSLGQHQVDHSKAFLFNADFGSGCGGCGGCGGGGIFLLIFFCIV